MDSPLVSIITRTRDRPRFLERACDSILAQVNPPPFEWIVVNDAGDAAEVEAVLAPARKTLAARLIVRHLDHSMGMEHASNFALRHASGLYATVHDDDDTWLPNFLRNMVAWLRHSDHQGFAGVVCHTVHVIETVENGDIRQIASGPFNTWLEQIDLWRLLQQNPFPPISFLFKRSVWEELGGFDESLPVLGDWEFNVRVALRHRLGLLPKALARYHHRRGSSNPAHANSVTAGDSLHRDWEGRLRERWQAHPPHPDLPHFGALSRVAAATFAASRTSARLLSLPLRPGPQ